MGTLLVQVFKEKLFLPFLFKANMILCRIKERKKKERKKSQIQEFEFISSPQQILQQLLPVSIVAEEFV